MGHVSWRAKEYRILSAGKDAPDGTLFFATPEDAKRFLLPQLRADRARHELIRVLQSAAPDFSPLRLSDEDLARELAPLFTGHSPRWRLEPVEEEVRSVSVLPEEKAAKPATGPAPATKTGERIRIRISVDKSSVTRGQSATFSAKVLEGTPASMEWEILPLPAEGIEGATAATSPLKSLKVPLLGPVRAILHAPGAEVTPEELRVAVTPRPGFTIDADGAPWKTVPPDLKAPLLYVTSSLGHTIHGGVNACNAEPACHKAKVSQDVMKTPSVVPVHVLHLNDDAKGWENVGYTLKTVDGEGPFKGFRYLDTCTLRIRRIILLNREIYDLNAGKVATATRKASAAAAPKDRPKIADDVKKYRDLKDEHERLHTEGMLLALKATGPDDLAGEPFAKSTRESMKDGAPALLARDLERMAIAPAQEDAAVLVNARIWGAEYALRSALSDHRFVRERMRAAHPKAGAGVVYVESSPELRHLNIPSYSDQGCDDAEDD